MIKPMLAKLTNSFSFDSSDYIWETKYNGIRCIAQTNSTTRLWSRSGREMTNNFPELEIVTKTPALLDGEIVSCDNSGKPELHRVQCRTIRQYNVQWAVIEYPCTYWVFDIIELSGHNLEGVPLMDRKELLDRILIPSHNVQLAPFTDNGEGLFSEMELKGWEGVIGKSRAGMYLPGKREWLKVKVGIKEVFYICGYTAGTGWRASTFGALVLGKLTDEGFQHVGSVGTGFNDAALRSVYQQLRESPETPCPFRAVPEFARWTTPRLQCLVHFAEYTKGGKLREPAFKGIV